MDMHRSGFPEDTTQLTPEEFETTVQRTLEAEGMHLEEFSTRHGEPVAGVDGSYKIDVTARFKALGVNFLVLVECKHQAHPVKRDVVQVLHDRIRSSGAQKGILFATSRFQRGAVEYAAKHRIALVRVADGATACITLSRNAPPPPKGSCGFVGWLRGLSRDGHDEWELLGEPGGAKLQSFFGVEATT